MTTNIETDLKEILLEIKADIKELKKDVSDGHVFCKNLLTKKLT